MSYDPELEQLHLEDMLAEAEMQKDEPDYGDSDEQEAEVLRQPTE